MGPKTILVNLNHEPRVPALIAAAAAIAQPREAHVIGLYVYPPLLMPGDVIMPLSSDFYDQLVEGHRAQAARIKAIFDEATRGQPYVAEWQAYGDVRTAYKPVADGIIAQSRAAELVIVSQAISGDDPPMLADVPARVSVESGRPTLVVPSSWAPRDYGQNITVAWDDSREAARAVFDALPLLERAKKVRIVTVRAPSNKDDDENGMCSADIAATLARRGIDVDVEAVRPDGRRTGDALLSSAAVDGSDLLVMGAYGHSRIREFILGGATWDVLKNMHIPVLLSH